MTIFLMKEIARRKGGECLSTSIEKGKKLRFKCQKGHEWDAFASVLKAHDSWCPFCTRVRKKTYEECVQIANSYNCALLTTKEDFDDGLRVRFEC